jgi:hypothetical protein
MADEMMTGPNTFDWTTLESLIAGAASRKMHVVFSPFIHWPGQPLRLPQFLSGVPMIQTNEGPTPDFGNTALLAAIEDFIFALGSRYNGDTRIFAIHPGLLGFWGEFHCYPVQCVPESAKLQVISWYKTAFPDKQIQARYPENKADSFGLYDGSFAYNTLDGAANGGKQVSWFLWPQVLSRGQQDFWKTAVMGGETRPELQSTIFTSSYPAGTENHQDFKKCVDTTHATYILHHRAFSNGGLQGTELQNARKAHAHMGYNFQVTQVAVANSQTTPGNVDLSVTVKQTGVAPFYYDLSLRLKCTGVSLKQSGVEKIINQGDVKTFEFKNIPATSDCLSSVSLSLESSYAYPDRPIKFAQGSDGTVKLNLPLPGQSTPTSPTPRDDASSSPSSNDSSNIITSIFSLAQLIAWLRSLFGL